jgi:hypothetical protein
VSTLGLPDVFVILGTVDSGRQEILNYLIQHGIAEDAHIVVYYSQLEQESPNLEKIRNRPNTLVQPWLFANGRISTVVSDIMNVSSIFFITDGMLNPIDQLEAVKNWFNSRNLPVTRIITVVNCRLAQQYTPVVEWYNGCIHFSDYVLLNNRENVPNKWMDDYLERYKKECYPCIFEFVKKGGKVENAMSVLDSEVRRMSTAFDPNDTIILELSPETLESLAGNGDLDQPKDPFATKDIFETMAPTEPLAGSPGESKKDIEFSKSSEIPSEENEEDLEEEEEIDPYFERSPAGSRKIKLPDIREFFPEK